MKAGYAPRSGVFVQNPLGDAPVNFWLSQQESLMRSLGIAGEQSILHTTDKGFDATNPCPTNVGALDSLTGPFQGRFMIGHKDETLKRVDQMYPCCTLRSL